MKKRNIQVQMWPRRPSDRGGILLMPMKKNVPTGHPDWTLTTCPNCGEECWQSSLMEIAKKQGAKALCTECTLKAKMYPREAQR